MKNVITVTGSENFGEVEFPSYYSAQEFAQFFSERYGCLTEVSDESGLIGQYIDGYPTPEFAGRSDVWSVA